MSDTTTKPEWRWVGRSKRVLVDATGKVLATVMGEGAFGGGTWHVFAGCARDEYVDRESAERAAERALYVSHPELVRSA